MNGKWSGTEGRHREPFIAENPLSRSGFCPCVSMKCHGTMNTMANHPDKVVCDSCALVIKKPAKQVCTCDTHKRCPVHTPLIPPP